MCPKSHRHSIFCILPPHILREIAKNSDDKKQREQALNTLGLDATSRTNRINEQFMAMNVARPLMTATPTAQRSIYTAGNGTDLPGRLVRAEGGTASKDVEADEAYDGLGATFNFYLQVMHRVSIDGQGLPLNATVHYDNAYDNAFWNGEQMVFGDGDGKQYKNNQAAADADWLIGAGLLTNQVNGKALRSMSAPGTAYNDPILGRDPQPDNMSKYVNTKSDNGGVHINSGIPNRAFFLVATALKGFSWDKAGQIWYSTLRDANLRTTATFSDFAKLTVINAGHLYGSSSAEVKAVEEAWKTVGVSIKPLTRA